MITSRIEDYLEAIYEIREEKKIVKPKDVRKKLKVGPSTLTEMLQKLERKGLVTYRKYGEIFLTKEGERIAKEVKKIHTTLVKFLKIIFVPEKIAEKDACTIEHSLDKKTVRQLVKFVSFVENSPAKFPKWRKHFKIYCKTGKHSCKHGEKNG